MQKRISTKKITPKKTKSKRDANQSAFATIQRTIELSEAEEPKIDKATISAVMAKLGRKGGKIGGKRRMETMSKEERSEAAFIAARARWDKKQS